MAGMPPATEAPKRRRRPVSRARASNSGPCSAMSSLLAVTTDLPARQRFSNPGAGGLEASDQFDDDIHVGGESFVEIFRPANVARSPIHFLFFDVADADRGEMQRAIWIGAEQLGDGAAHGAETREADSQFLFGGGVSRAAGRLAARGFEDLEVKVRGTDLSPQAGFTPRSSI